MRNEKNNRLTAEPRGMGQEAAVAALAPVIQIDRARARLKRQKAATGVDGRSWAGAGSAGLIGSAGSPELVRALGRLKEQLS